MLRKLLALLFAATLTLAPAASWAASGQTLAIIGVQQNEPPAANPAQWVVRNGILMLAFDTTTAEYAIFKAEMPQHYSNATGITVVVTWMAASATSGTIGWTIEIERMTTDEDADSWASAATVTAATVSGTSGIASSTSVNIAAGSAMDSVVAGDWFRVRVKRDVASDNAAGDAQLIGVVIREQ